MKYYIGNTDIGWYRYLKGIHPEDINFWQPNGASRFRAIEKGAPFLFRLKSPVNKVAGVGFFSTHSLLPVDFAWEVFGPRNGTDDYSRFMAMIRNLRNPVNPLDKNPNIGCIVLTNPVFFDENDWLPVPASWSGSIVQGKTYSTEEPEGRAYWEKVRALISVYGDPHQPTSLTEGQSPAYTESFTRVRIGQGAFRVLVTDAYSRRCAISGEKTLPVLEAAHIKSYASAGINSTDNGLLLRSDLHKLFDTGYITVTESLHVEISRRIREEFQNGRDYYKYHGHQLASLPSNKLDYPNKDYLRWHNEQVYKG